MSDTRERLLDAAEALIVEAGASALSIREVARRTGLTAMAVYRHFDGIDALRGALKDRGLAALLASHQGVLSESTPRARLVASARSYLSFAVEHPALFTLLFTGGNPPEEAARHAEMRRSATSFRFQVDRVREAIDSGLLPPGDPELRTIQWWAFFHGLAVLYNEGKLKLTREELDRCATEAIERWLLRG